MCMVRMVLCVFVLCVSLGSVLTLSAQQIERKVVRAERTELPITIDGIFDEIDWLMVEPATGFRQNNPRPGKPASQNTEVRLLYDDEALYVAATMYDVHNDSIARQLSQRDQTENADIFAIYIDTYNDRLNAFQFMVTASGVKVDARLSPLVDDLNWDAVWYSDVHIADGNWYVEMKIPFSALRFPKKDVQTWGVNFFREIRRFREQSYWNFVNPAVDGFVNQFGTIEGVHGVKANTRLFFFPYASAYLENVSNPETGASETNTVFNGGMDIKYGINDAFTLDVTLIPDFGQVLPDNEVLNLSPFEVFFVERRQFFTEGTELFSKGDIFYSRRIGGRPLNYFGVQGQLHAGETIVENPQETQLINSTKFSGRTNSGLGVGVLNSVTAPTFATVENQVGERRRVMTNPFSNYNVFVLDQNLKNNSYVSLINTSVWREGADYDANVTATDFKLMDKTNTWQMSGVGAVSQKYGTTQGTDLGYRYFMSMGKVSGNFQYRVEHQLETDRYDPNDLGFLASNNEMATRAILAYNVFEPYSLFLRSWTNFSINHFRLFNPSTFTGFTSDFSHRFLLRNFLMISTELSAAPIGWKDYFETRTFEQFYMAPRMYSAGGWISSDYSKVLAIDANFYYTDFHENERHEFSYSLSPRWRVSDRLFFIAEANFQDQFDDMGYVARSNQNDIVFGKRDRKTVESLLTARYNFGPNMDIFFRLRHYWSRAVYDQYYTVGAEGELFQTDHLINHNVNFNVFNIDLAYTWIFTPGSELSIVWKNVINETGDEIPDTYFNNVQNLLDLPQLNSLSIRVLFFVDYLWLRKKK